MGTRRILALALALAVVVAVLAPIALLEARRTPDWQSELQQYLGASGIVVSRFDVWAAEAQRVDVFPAEVLAAQAIDWPWQGVQQIPPAERVRCLRLEGPGAGDEVDLLAGYHHDGLWRVGWLVYEFREGVDAQAVFDEMGCQRWEAVVMDGG